MITVNYLSVKKTKGVLHVVCTLCQFTVTDLSSLLQCLLVLWNETWNVTFYH